MATAAGIGLLAVVINLVARSSSATGGNTVGAYVGVSAAMWGLLVYSMKGRGIMEQPLSPWRNYVALLPAVVFLGEAQFERVSMMFIVLMVVAVGRHYAAFRIRWRILANAAYVMLVVPVFVFPVGMEYPAYLDGPGRHVVAKPCYEVLCSFSDAYTRGI